MASIGSTPPGSISPKQSSAQVANPNLRRSGQAGTPRHGLTPLELPQKGSRHSLSAWYDDAFVYPSSGSDANASPKRHGEHDDSPPPHSPLKRGRWASEPRRFNMVQDSSDEDTCGPAGEGCHLELRMTPPRKKMGTMHDHGPACRTTTAATLRSVCEEYFESNLAPIIDHLQETQKQYDAQLKMLQADIERRTQQDDSLVMEKLTQLTAEVELKADSSYVQELAQNVETSNNFRSIELQVERVWEQLQADRKIHGQIQMLSQELRNELHELRTEVREKLNFDSEPGIVTSVPLGVLDHEVRRIDQMVCRLQEDLAVVGERWPGRVLSSAQSWIASDGASDVGSLTGSFTESVTSSMMGLGSEDLDEQKKLLPQVSMSGRARLAARRQRRQDRFQRQGRIPLATHPESDIAT